MRTPRLFTNGIVAPQAASNDTSIDRVETTLASKEFAAMGAISDRLLRLLDNWNRPEIGKRPGTDLWVLTLIVLTDAR